MHKAKAIYQTITGVSSNNSLCPELDLKTRIIGFVISFIVGIFMMISSVSQLFTLALGGQKWFAVWYTLGNCVCLSSSFFLMGPKKQCEYMMKPQRKLTTMILFISMISCLIMAFTGISKIIILIAIIVQFLALSWYVVSYIPGAQNLCSSCIKRSISRKLESSDNYTEMSE